jgi:hypothetical protein
MTDKESKNIDKNQVIMHLVDTYDNDFMTMLILFKSKSYNRALFLGHISV